MKSISTPRLILGMLLIGTGVALILMNTGYLPYVRVWHFWPMLLVFGGLSKLFGDRKERSDGFLLLLIGLWMQAATLKLFGLTWGNSWPLLLVVWGLHIMWRAMDRKSNVIV